MTKPGILEALLPLVRDLSLALPADRRFARLLEAVQALFACDACALLRLDGEVLVPLAVRGLRHDTLGRRFRVDAHPRLRLLMSQDAPTLFDSDSALPDPYDGLVADTDPAERLAVHDCMGCPLTVNGRRWGLLTLDALSAGRFAEVDLQNLAAFASLAAATVAAAERLDLLESDLQQERVRAEAYRLAADGAHGARQLTGHSPAMQALRQEIRTAGNSELTVLIRGETGTGKELVATALHAASLRSKKAMVTINCAALPETLVESELFGHVRGSFSGATTDRSGKFELANGGTLFLDEVGELSLAVQAKLLRVMQSGQLQRVGSDRDHRVDVRVIAASNRDLAEEVRQGRCRADFYHRLSVYPLQVPPLRDRGRDVLLIAGFYLEENRARLGLAGLRLSADAETALLAHDWPGNVRELEHLLARSALKALSAESPRPRILTLQAAHLGLSAAAAGVHHAGSQTPTAPTGETPPVALREALAEHERRLIRQSLERQGHNWAAAARELGLDRANLNRSARRLGLKRAG